MSETTHHWTKAVFTTLEYPLGYPCSLTFLADGRLVMNHAHRVGNMGADVYTPAITVLPLDGATVQTETLESYQGQSNFGFNFMPVGQGRWVQSTVDGQTNYVAYTACEGDQQLLIACENRPELNRTLHGNNDGISIAVQDSGVGPFHYFWGMVALRGTLYLFIDNGYFTWRIDQEKNPIDLTEQDLTHHKLPAMESFYTEWRDGVGNLLMRPSVCSDGNTLHVAYKDRDNNICLLKKKSGSDQWGTVHKLRDQATSGSPAIAALHGRLFIAYKDDKNSRIWITSCPLAKLPATAKESWDTEHLTNQQTKGGLSLAASPETDRLVLTYCDDLDGSSRRWMTTYHPKT